MRCEQSADWGARIELRRANECQWVRSGRLCAPLKSLAECESQASLKLAATAPPLPPNALCELRAQTVPCLGLCEQIAAVAESRSSIKGPAGAHQSNSQLMSSRAIASRFFRTAPIASQWSSPLQSSRIAINQSIERALCRLCSLTEPARKTTAAALVVVERQQNQHQQHQHQNPHTSNMVPLISGSILLLSVFATHLNCKPSSLMVAEAKPLNQYQVKFRRLPPREFSTALGSSLTIECQAESSPPPTIHWLKDGKRILQVSN